MRRQVRDRLRSSCRPSSQERLTGCRANYSWSRPPSVSAVDTAYILAARWTLQLEGWRDDSTCGAVKPATRLAVTRVCLEPATTNSGTQISEFFEHKNHFVTTFLCVASVQ